MKLPYRILVVDDDEHALEGMLEMLRAAEYRVAGAASFEAAKRLLAVDTYDLLITDVRLRGFNGLHLVRQIRSERADMATMIITGYDEPMMELEAGRYGAAFVRKPFEPGAFLAAVARSVAEVHRQRRWARKQILGRLTVVANGRPAAVIDVSYGGLRIELSPGEPPPARFAVDIRAIGLHLDVDSVWYRPAGDGTAVLCGATLATETSSAAAAWRTIVDRLSA